MIQIGRKEIYWNYAATFLKIASSVLLLPLILRIMPSEKVGIWSVIMTLTSVSWLLDFGFSVTFTRNVTYVFSGVQILKVKGFESVLTENPKIDYGLLKGVIFTMRWLYLRMAIILFLLLSTIGTYYIHSILLNYKGDHQEVYISWGLLCIITTYNLFTLYYDSLLQGKGLVKRSKQILIIGQMVYLIIASLFLIAGYGLVAIVSAQASSVIIIRWLSYNAFFSSTIKQKLQTAISHSKNEIFKAIYPNAMKIGLTSLGSFMVSRSAIIIGSMYLKLDNIASYGITLQLISVIVGLSTLYTTTFQPKIAQLRIEQNNSKIKDLYMKGQIIMLVTFIVGGVCLLIIGEWGLKFIGSHTILMPRLLILGALFVLFLENNHSLAGSILISKNEVPFFKASILSGGLTVLLLLLLFHYTNFGLWAMIAAPGFAQGIYQNWKWPIVVINELKITKKDIYKSIVNIIN
jgi:O-antigen/teichoic acid export membrane protein